MQHDFEDIEVKRNAPQILEEQLRRKRKLCMIGTGAMCDPYIPLESELKLTRQCLELIEKYGFGLSILTKSQLILRDLDLLQSINAKAKCVVQVTLTTFDEELCRIIEPGVSTTRERFHILEAMREAGIPTIVWLSPFLPFINDTEENLRGLLDYCVQAGVMGVLCFGIGMTLREGNREYFYAKLDEYFPGVKEDYLLNYGNAYSCLSKNSSHLMAILRSVCKQHGLLYKTNEVLAFLKEFDPSKKQLSLFD